MLYNRTYVCMYSMYYVHVMCVAQLYSSATVHFYFYIYNKKKKKKISKLKIKKSTASSFINIFSQFEVTNHYNVCHV
jgi:hypothetical protein